MEASIEDIRASLAVLGLEPGATVEEVHTAFRELVRTCHPDVAGSRETARFQEITSAYSLLKGLTPEMLAAEEQKPAEKERGTLFDWYQKRRREQLDEMAEEERKDAPTLPFHKRADRVLEQYERELSRCLEHLAQEMDQGEINGLLLRLRSSVPEVRRLALSRVGVLANHDKILAALVTLLCREKIDEETARLLSSLPFAPESLSRLAQDSASHASNLPNSLLSTLLGFRERNRTVDISLMERYLLSASPSGGALLLRYWPREKPFSESALRQLLTSEEPQILVPLLSMMKQNFPHAAPRHKKRLEELSRHDAPAVRLWSQALLKAKD